jgi:hypothetical protein
LVAPFSTDSIFITGDLNLDMRFVLNLNYKHVRTAGLTVCRHSSRLIGTAKGIYQQAERHSSRDTSRQTVTVASIAAGRRNSSGIPASRETQ